MLVEVKLDQEFPKEIIFLNEKGIMTCQLVVYECKLVFCFDCKGIGHTMAECKKKRIKIAAQKIKHKQVWVEKKQQNAIVSQDVGKEKEFIREVVQGEISAT